LATGLSASQPRRMAKRQIRLSAISTLRAVSGAIVRSLRSVHWGDAIHREFANLEASDRRP
jgi:hypothetical protein